MYTAPEDCSFEYFGASRCRERGKAGNYDRIPDQAGEQVRFSDFFFDQIFLIYFQKFKAQHPFPKFLDYSGNQTLTHQVSTLMGYFKK